MNAGRKVSRRTRGKALVLGSRRILSVTAIAMAVVMPTGLVSASPALAASPSFGRPAVADRQEPVDGRDLKALPRKSDADDPGPPAKASWPSPGIAEVTVPTASPSARSATADGPQKAAALPIAVTAPKQQKQARGGTEAAGRVRVQMLERGAARNLGVNGVAFTVARTDAAAPGRVGLQLDYSGFEQAFGGAYGTRLRLMQMPHCALTTPSEPRCRTPIPLETVNDGEAKTVTAEVEAVPAAASGSPAVTSAGANATLLVVAAAAEGSQGDYQATSLQPSATWNAGGSSGDFSWSYPMRVPGVPGGLAPQVGLSYSSSSVDGRTSNTNGQPSWVGQGFDLWPGYIERSYKSCKEDGAPEDEWGNSPGDQCWAYDNATIAWSGKGGELVKAADGTWRLKNDDGTKFEKLTESSNDIGDDNENGDDNGEYWKVTTTDGTQYFFGLNRAPGWVSGKPETNSTWTAPVFGDDSGEPCHDSAGFSDSWCQQAYRWNLDYVVDKSGNAILYTYGTETNHYGRNLKPEDETAYVRGGYLKTISYGLRSDAVFAKAPAQVTFATSERCIRDASFDCAPSKIGDNPDRWWDVPWDLNCNSGQECKETHGTISPSFWSRLRLTEVTTQILKPDASGYQKVDSWSLDHEWKFADVERDLVLNKIQHTGHASTDGSNPVTLPKVSFNYVQKENRLDESGDDILAYIRYRLGAIYDEAGGQIEINYAAPDCSRADLPTPESNATRCMPVIWTPPGREDPMTDWFHKYVVSSVTQVDRTGLSPHMTTRYEYVGGAAWHFDDDDGLVKEKDKTWSQWRGYGHVRTFTGDPADPATQTDTYYMRGMDGDRQNKAGGEKSVTVSDGEGGTHTDHDALAGFPIRTVQYTEPGGSVHAKTVNTPWRTQTASRTRSWGTVTANVTGVDTSRTWTAKDGGGWNQTKTENTFKQSGPGVGRVTTVNNLGDVTTGTDDTCTRTTYADNTGAWMVDHPSRVETVSTACATTPERPDQVISDVRSYYDGHAHGAAPTKGQVTKVEGIKDYDGGAPRYVTEVENTYDSYGRVTHTKNALGQTSTTAYTDTQGLTSKVVSTTPPANPANASTALTTTQELDRALGLPSRATDANGMDTDLVYDGLGRLRKVWLPDRSKANDPTVPSYEYTYRFEENEIVAVTSKAIVAGGLKVTGISLLDGWLRPRQTQSPTQAAEGQSARLISDTFYDDRGQVTKTYAPYPATGAPEAELFGVHTPGAVETQGRADYDGLGRPTVQRLIAGSGSQPEQELWRTTYSYGGANRVSVTPPDGGTPTAQVTNALGQVTERRQYKADTPTGDYDATTYTYTPAGQPATVTDPSGNEWTTTYDLRGRTTHKTDPDAGTSTFTYDDLDRTVSTTDARDETVHTNYDGLGRVTDTRAGSATGTKLTSFTYDTVAKGKGKPASATRHHNGAQYTSNILRYDNLGRAQTTNVTIPAAEGPLAGTYVTNTEYNIDGTPRSVTPPTAGGLPYETLVYSYDDFARPTRMSSNRGTYISHIGYRDTGELQAIDYGTVGKRAFQTFHYQDGTRRLQRANTSREGINGYARSALYDYTDAGTITSITDTSHDGVDKQCFTYDHLQRLTQAWTQGTTDTCATEPAASLIGGPAPYWNTFTYDKAGNRTEQVQHGLGGQDDTVSTYTYAAPGNGSRLHTLTRTGPEGDRTRSYGYDPTGNTTSITTTEGPANTTQTFDFNTEGQLAKVSEQGNDVTYIYDTGGNRLIRKDPTGTTLYLPGGTELRAYNGATTATGTRYYSLGGQTVAMRTTDGTVTYMTADHQGTANIAIDAATQQATVRRFTPFGNIRSLDEDATWPNDKGFLGATQEPTGLTHLGAREYDPDTGRFISVDPILNQADPQQMNGYTYANNSPATYSDPTGTCPGNSCSADYFGPRPGYSNAGNSSRDWSAGRPSPGNSARDWSSGGSSRVSRVMARPCTGSSDTSSCFVDQWRMMMHSFGDYPRPTVTVGDVWAATWQTFGDLLGVEDVNDCFTGKSKTACVWAAANWVPGLGKLLKPGSKWLKYFRNLDNVDDPPAPPAKPREGSEAPAGRPRAEDSPAAKPEPEGCSSFVPGTQVLLADGSSQDIEDIEVGDKVVATDPETSETSAQPVLGVITTKGDKHLVQITVDADTTSSFLGAADATGSPRSLMHMPYDSGNGVVVATDTHPFWVAGDISAWVEAADLQPGMWLRTSAGTYVQITATKTWTQSQRVYNLTIAIDHTYYVLAGNASTLVHNACTPGHTAVVTVLDSNGVVRDSPGPVTFWSGRTTPAEQAQGPWKGGMASHTEARATRAAGTPWRYWKNGDDPLLGVTPANAGDTYYLEGALPPCSWCRKAMEDAAEATDTNWVYTWVEDGERHFWWRGL
ncbi:hypothetical protein GCM10010182_46340 [Actinomadura cremea]|nr:hypothetical protein GCM10010182_46340 [Actinomadura cremea]